MVSSLVELQVENFKSYAGNQTIGPFDGFTCIIGPNGSGKSNLMDAISFVLGLDARQLRSTALKDLINRSDDPSVKSAFVVAKICPDPIHSPNQFVFFKRAVSSTSNSSTYYVDEKEVSFKDFQATLELCHVPEMGSNCLVFQGDVEAIAGKTPTELCRLVERLSGSDALRTSYDNARQSLDRAVEASTAAFAKRKNFSERLRSLEQQQEQSEQYSSLLVERKDAIHASILQRLFKTEQEKRQAVESLSEAQQEQQSLIKQLAAEESALQSARARHAASTKVQVTLQMQHKEVALRVGQRDSSQSAIQQMRLIQSQITALSDRLTRQLKPREQATERQLAASKQQLGMLKQAFSSWEKERTAAAEKSSLPAAVQNDVLRLRATIQQATSTERHDVARLKRALSLAEHDFSQLELRLNTLVSSAKEQEHEKNELQQQKDSLIHELETILVPQRTELQQQTVSLQQRLQSISDERAEKERCLDEAAAALQVYGHARRLGDRERQVEGAIEALQRLFPDAFYGRLQSLIRSANPTYSRAVQIALGRLGDAIVVGTERVAIECIRWLRSNRFPPLTLLPLDTLQARSTDAKLRGLGSGVRPAIDVVVSNSSVIDADSFEKLAGYALGGCIIADSLQQAQQLTAEGGPAAGCKCVSIDGTLFHRSGLITGGSEASGTSIADARQAENLRNVRSSQQAAIEQLLIQSAQAQRSLSLATQQLQSLQLRVASHEQRIAALGDRLASVGETLSWKEKEIVALKDSDVASAQKKVSQLKAQLNEQLGKLLKAKERLLEPFCNEHGVSVDAVIGRNDDFENGFGDADKEALRFSTALASLTRQIEAEEDAFAAAKQQVSNANSTLESLESQNRQAQQVASDAAKAIASLDDEAQKIESQLTKTFSETKRAAEELRKIRQSHSELAQRVDFLATAVATRDAQRLMLQRRWEDLCSDAEVERLPTALYRGNLSQSDLVQFRWDSKKFSIDKRASHSVAELDAQLRDRLNQISIALSSLPPSAKPADDQIVAEAQDRYSAAVSDLEAARESCRQARDQFNAVRDERRALFNAAFSHVASKIDSIYRVLVSDDSAIAGTAYLTAEEVEEPYLGGLRFHVMPPGKRFRELELLSGGERTIAALALLFALQSWKKSAFFVLDEVDAALDAENVQRVARYLADTANRGESQFVAISLKSSFFQHADSLAGIYRSPQTKSSAVLTLSLREMCDGAFYE